MDGKRSRDQYEQYSSQSGYAKRPRYDEVQTPSKVLHVRKLPMDVADSDLYQLAMPFGRVVTVLVLQGKGQGFVQMEDVQQAMGVVQYYTSVPAMVRGQQCYIQFSNRNEISASSQQGETQNRILLVSVSNLVYPITIDVLHRVFKKYGAVLRIVTFSKGANLQALIEYDQIIAAVHAKTELEGQNIYTGCCTLGVHFSNLETLTVKYNNERSRDFTNPHLPSGGNDHAGLPSLPVSGGPSGIAGDLAGNPVAYGYGGYPMPGSSMAYGAMGAGNPIHVSPMGMGGALGSTVVIASGFNESHVSPDVVFTLFGVYGDVLRVKILFNKKDTALIQFTNHQGADFACQYLNGVQFMGSTLKVNFSKHQSVSLPKGDSSEANSFTKDYTNSPLHRFKYANPKLLSHITAPVEMLHVTNLANDVTQAQLVSLFSQYGNVVASNVFEKGKKMALVQMNSVEEALQALVHLHNYHLNGSYLRVSFSKSRIQRDGGDVVPEDV